VCTLFPLPSCSLTTLSCFPRFVFCDACEAETHNRAMPVYFPAEDLAGTGAWTAVPGDSIASLDGRMCRRYDRLHANRGRGEVFQIWVDTAGLPCRTVADNEQKSGVSDAGGETIDFWDVQETASQALLAADSSWNCPLPICAVNIDLVMIFDESSSIQVSDFDAMKAFMRDVVRNNAISARGVQRRA
jgi:hypothetical protein